MARLFHISFKCCDYPSRIISPKKMKQCIILTASWLFLFAFLMYVTGPFVRVPIAQNEKLEQNLRVLSRRLSLAFRELDRLKKQNEGLKMVIKLGLAKNNETIKSLLQKEEIALSNANNALKNCKSISPPVEYEQTRRMTDYAVQNMWLYLQHKFSKLQSLVAQDSDSTTKNELTSLVINTAGRIQFILSKLLMLPKVDGHAKWRQWEADYLKKIVQNRIMLVQNPPACSAAKVLQCELNASCVSFDCKLERTSACLSEAYRLHRTLVLNDHAWNSNFQPLSIMCSDIGTNEDYPSAPWPGTSNDLRIILGPEVKVQSYAEVPFDLSTRLNRLSGDPLLWWRGQLFAFLLSPLPNLSRLIQRVKDKIKFVRSPIIGICVDKEEYLDEVISAVDHFYQQFEMTSISMRRRIFVSSRSPDIPLIIKKTYQHIDVLHISEEILIEVGAQEFSEDESEFPRDVLDTHFLSKTDFLVSADSRKLCQIAFSLQMSRTDAHNKLISIGSSAAFDHKKQFDHLAIVKHVAQSDEEIDLGLGDIVIGVENLANGYSKGKNKITKRKGIFPSYKVTCLTRYKHFSDFLDEISAKGRFQDTKPKSTTKEEEVYEYED
ncbi:alpha-(1,6)-fucosyltransferase-like [Neocloeon triangulifer]|uniref:alpha-(1,6)-fucosyltransferase-like n=1 Tax=Neocloeon triangulifer TaxID=2078957 RepID=UPI00286F4F42|nr:alpha-(1,6)-fucosyltransferase-like [Neocloeon triangulifer]